MKRFEELKQRAALAWRILRDRDGALARHTIAEFDARGDFQAEGPDNWIAHNVLDLVRVFSAQGHSGSSAPFAISMFKTVASFKPLGPLTGADSEWFDHGFSDGTRYQNKRAGHVFKGDDGIAYDIDAVVFEEPDGCRFTSYHSRMPVTFPYTPRSVVAQVPEESTAEQQKMLAAQAWA